MEGIVEGQAPRPIKALVIAYRKAAGRGLGALLTY